MSTLGANWPHSCIPQVGGPLKWKDYFYSPVSPLEIISVYFMVVIKGIQF